jgi:hypothetical protein
MVNNNQERRLTFHAFPQYFFNYAEAYRNDSWTKAITLPSLGLVPQVYATDHLDPNGMSQPPWVRFKSFIESLNAQEPASKFYKVLYLTRHGLGYHNVFEAKVGREAWNVG